MVLTLMLTQVSCLEEADCVSIENDRIELNFKSLIDGTSKAVKIDSVYYTQYVVGTYQGDSISRIYIDLPPVQKNLEVVVHSKIGSDTLWFEYDFIPQLFASQCEVEFLFSDQRLTGHTFDSLVFEMDELIPHASIYH